MPIFYKHLWMDHSLSPQGNGSCNCTKIMESLGLVWNVKHSPQYIVLNTKIKKESMFKKWNVGCGRRRFKKSFTITYIVVSRLNVLDKPHLKSQYRRTMYLLDITINIQGEFLSFLFYVWKYFTCVYAFTTHIQCSQKL